MTVDEVDACADAGARFLVSPGYDDAVAARAQELGILVLPGVATATEIQRAVAAGLDAVKVFPAEPPGGLALISALSSPFAGLQFMPSGGIDADNAASYLANPAVFAIGGSWMATRAHIASRDFESIRDLTRRAASLV